MAIWWMLLNAQIWGFFKMEAMHINNNSPIFDLNPQCFLSATIISTNPLLTKQNI